MTTRKTKTGPALYTYRDGTGTVVEITEGMGATMGIGSDSYANTVVKVVGPKTVQVRRDTVTPGPNYDYHGNQDDVTFTPNLWAKAVTLTLRSDGQWREAGTTKSSGYHWYFGGRRQYSDPSF